jgi:hypothetical protein
MTETRESYTAARLRLLEKQPAAVVAVTNGESVAGTLRSAGLAAEVIVWRDVLHDGPVLDLAPAKLRQLRARHTASRYGLRAAEVLRELAERDRALSRHARDQLVLWFEADLHDQLQLIQVLDRLRRLRADPQDITMISIGEHPDRAHFGGLGELNGEQLRGLLPAARRLSAHGFDLASRAWQAFTASDPSALVALRGVNSTELRYLGEAVGRLLREHPSRSDGLSVTQRRILLAVDAGLRSFPEILRSHWQSEQRPFLGDLGCLAEVQYLATAAHPALEQSGDVYMLTALGRHLLAAEVDWITINGIDRWIGGVRLLGRAVPWRYDERLETLVRTG